MILHNLENVIRLIYVAKKCDSFGDVHILIQINWISVEFSTILIESNRGFGIIIIERDLVFKHKIY